MKHKDGSRSSEDHDKMVDNASSSSFSPSSSINNGEKNDVTFPEFKENEESISQRSNPENEESISRRSNPENEESISRRSNSESSTSSTPKTSSSGRLTLNLSLISSPRFSDYDTLNASPVQSPPIQVMAQSDGYDPNRIPSSIFAPKPSDDSEWSATSNESLFSIHMGSNSFSLDSDFFVSQSGKIHWIDDGFEFSCFTPNGSLAPMVAETTVDDERKSEHREKEELETLTVREKDRSPDSKVKEFNGARNSESSSQSSGSSGSFAFPVLEGGSPVKEDVEKPQSPTAEGASKPPPAAPATTPKAGGNQWFNCFSCFPICC